MFACNQSLKDDFQIKVYSIEFMKSFNKFLSIFFVFEKEFFFVKTSYLSIEQQKKE